jgi:hypothetical protein
LLPFLADSYEAATLTRPRGRPTSSPLCTPQREERNLDPYPSKRSCIRTRRRYTKRRILSPARQATHARQTNPFFARLSILERTRATITDARGFHRKNTFPLPRQRTRPLLSPRATHVMPTSTRWAGLVRLIHHLRRDLEWWLTVPRQHNGHSIYKPIETTCLHASCNDYGWGAVFNENPRFQAREFWYGEDPPKHITWEELRAVRHANDHTDLNLEACQPNSHI